MDVDSCRAYILAGGESRRFGANKALVVVDGVPLLQKLAIELKQDGFLPVVVAQRFEDYAQWRTRETTDDQGQLHSEVLFQVITDRSPKGGPLAGVEAALMDCTLAKQKKCWLLTCDMLDWNPAWNRLASEQTPLHQLATVFDYQDSFRPFPGCYHVDSLAALQETWQKGRRSIAAWHEQLGPSVGRIQIEENLLPLTFNTPGELEVALKQWKLTRLSSGA